MTDHRPPPATGSTASPQALLRLASGLLLLFAAVGFAAWLSGAASWVAFYCGARGRTLTHIAQLTLVIGFALAVFTAFAWHVRRCHRGRTTIPARAVLVACLTLTLGNIFWAIFVDAIAWHYGDDIVRPAFDTALMYLVLGAVLPLTLGTPPLLSHLARRHA